MLQLWHHPSISEVMIDLMLTVELRWVLDPMNPKLGKNNDQASTPASTVSVAHINQVNKLQTDAVFCIRVLGKML